MLKFKKLSMNNFGPYRNLEEIEFPIDGGIVIIRGRNGRGKTSILNALRFVLFGQVKVNGRTIVPLVSLVNQIGFENKQYEYRVSLILERNNEEFEVTRAISPKTNEVPPTQDKDYSHPILTILNRTKKKFLLPEESALFLNQIMTEPVSRFYLFDGELLKEYENQLSETDEGGAKQIKDGIERILGVPILKNAKYHIDLAYNELERTYNKVLASDKQTEALGRARATLENQRDEYLREFEELSKELKDIDEELKDKNSRFKRYEADRAALTERNNIKFSLDSLNNNKQDKEDEKKDLMNYAWLALLRPILLKSKESIDAEIHEIEANAKAVETRDKLIKELQSSIDSSRCEFCKQPLNQEAIGKLKELLSEKMNEVNNTTPIDSQRFELLKKQSQCISSLETSDVTTASKAIKKYDKEIFDLSRKIALEKANYDEAVRKVQESSTSPEELQQLAKDVAVLSSKRMNVEKGVKSAEYELNTRINKIKEIDARLKEMLSSGNIETARSKMEYMEKFKDLLDESILSYQDELRKNVQLDATDLFLKLSSEKEYAGLKINDNYRLDIIDKDGKIIPLRSSGYEHLVAFALIGALHKNAPMRGPLFMDTSFGRLDKENSENLIRVLPDLSEQVIILVHDREIDEEMITRLIPHSIKARYGIERISARESHLKHEECN